MAFSSSIATAIKWSNAELFLDGRVQWLGWLRCCVDDVFFLNKWPLGRKNGKFTSSEQNWVYRLWIDVCYEYVDLCLTLLSWSCDVSNSFACLKLIVKLHLDYTSRYMNKSNVSNLEFSIIPLNSSGLHEMCNSEVKMAWPRFDFVLLRALNLQPVWLTQPPKRYPAAPRFHLLL